MRTSLPILIMIVFGSLACDVFRYDIAEDGTNGGVCIQSYICNEDLVCFQEFCCAPYCTGKLIGDDDGCGGRCGSGGSILEWQNPPSADEIGVGPAKYYCENLLLDGHTDWYLPSIDELRTLIRGCPASESWGACDLTDYDDSCRGCQNLEGPAYGCYWPDGMVGECETYWSSSRNEEAIRPWAVDFFTGKLTTVITEFGAVNNVRCVR